MTNYYCKERGSSCPAITREFLKEQIRNINTKRMAVAALYLGEKQRLEVSELFREDYTLASFYEQQLPQGCGFQLMGIPTYFLPLEDHFHMVPHVYAEYPPDDTQMVDLKAELKAKDSQIEELGNKLKEAKLRSRNRFLECIRMKNGIRGIYGMTRLVGAEHISKDAAITIRNLTGSLLGWSPGQDSNLQL